MAGLENTNHRSVLAKYLSILTVEKTVLNCKSLPTDFGDLFAKIATLTK